MNALRFTHRDEEYIISLEPETLGHVIQRRRSYRYDRKPLNFGLPHPEWVILGVSHHHWRNSIDVPITPDVDPEQLEGGLVWDLDHGTTRVWGGSYHGKLPRIRYAKRIKYALDHKRIVEQFT